MTQQERTVWGDVASPAPELWRRTTIECGPLRITREYRLVAAVPRAPARSGWRLAGLVAMIGTAGIGGLAVAATKTAPNPAYSISVPVPAPKAERSAAAQPASVPIAHAHRSLKARDKHMTPAAEQNAADRAAAITAAFTTGVMQEWHSADGDEHGFVVAGAPEEKAGTTCRALSVLIRPVAGGDRVEQLRECRERRAG